MCVVQELESDHTSSHHDSVNITTEPWAEVAHLKTLLEDKAGKNKQAQQQHVVAEAQSAVQVADLKTRMDTELAALKIQLECEQKRRVAAEEQHKAAQADLALASEVTEHLKCDQAVLLTEVGTASALVMQGLQTDTGRIGVGRKQSTDAADMCAWCQCSTCSRHVFEEPDHLAVPLSCTVLRHWYVLHSDVETLFCRSLHRQDAARLQAPLTLAAPLPLVA